MDGANAELKEATFFAALKMHSSFILPILGYFPAACTGTAASFVNCLSVVAGRARGVQGGGKNFAN